MLCTVIKSEDVAVRAERETAAARVVTCFGNQLPDRRLLCFLDDEDWKSLKDEAGVANRGFYAPFRERDRIWREAPDYLRQRLFVGGRPAFDDCIYLHGSTCSNDIGLTMTFAHELQHFVQHGSVVTLWAANGLILRLDRFIITALGLRWKDIPIEREARIVSKRTAENLFGSQVVRQYIEAKISESVDANDIDDWRFIREIVFSEPYDLKHETELLFPRLNYYKADLKEALQQLNNDSDFKDVNLDSLLSANA